MEKGRRIGFKDSGGETFADYGDFLLRSVDTQWQGPAHPWIVTQRGKRGLCQMLGQGMAGPGVNTQGEMDGDFPLRLGGMQPASRQVKDIARLEDRVDVRRALSGLFDGGAAIRPRLASQRIYVDRLMDDPALGSLDLQHEDVVDVVVIIEATVLRRGDVSVGLHRMSEFSAQLRAETRHRLPRAVQRLQDEGGAVSEFAPQRGVVKLVGDGGADPCRRSVGGLGKRGAAFGDAQERRPQPTPRNQFVHCAGRKNIGKVADTAGEQGGPPPDITGEFLLADVDQARFQDPAAFHGAGVLEISTGRAQT